ncbi:MAG: HesA/MoeB/ThiF family protein [Methanobacteriaceae archaeon]
MPERFSGMAYWEMITRQMGIVTKSQQTRFKEAHIAVIGCGGIGGATIEILARMGVGKLTVIDKDVFDFSNLNRQVMSNLTTIGKSKSEVTRDTVRFINPYVDVKYVDGELNETNAEEIFADVDIVIDALDNLLTRVIASRVVRKLNIPFVHGAVHGTMGQITTFTNETSSYEELFSLPSKDKDLDESIKNDINLMSKDTPPVIGPVPNIIGCLEAFEAFKIITGAGDVILAPKVLNFDLLSNNPFNTIELE